MSGQLRCSPNPDTMLRSRDGAKLSCAVAGFSYLSVRMGGRALKNWSGLQMDQPLVEAPALVGRINWNSLQMD